MKKFLFTILLLVGFHTILPSQPTAAPSIPESILFCGESIDLTRYDMRERFDREQLAFMYMHSSSIQLVKRANRYFPIIEPILKKHGVPDDIKYLAVIESNLDPLAQSPARAAGIWQFLPTTGKDYGLEVNDEIDERYHVEKATEAACKYLLAAYAKFGDWATTCASYNIGQARISKERMRQSVQSSFDMLLVSETTRYVYRILAAKQFLENPSAFNFSFTKATFYHTVRTKDVAVNYSVSSWAEWAKNQGINYSMLRYYNPWIRSNELNSQGKMYQVRIPLKEDLNFDINKVHVHNPNWVK